MGFDSDVAKQKITTTTPDIVKVKVASSVKQEKTEEEGLSKGLDICTSGWTTLNSAAVLR